jgi:hypothetical protein
MRKSLTKSQILKRPPSLKQAGSENGEPEFDDVYGVSSKATGRKHGLLKPSEDEGPGLLKKPTQNQNAKTARRKRKRAPTASDESY